MTDEKKTLIKNYVNHLKTLSIIDKKNATILKRSIGIPFSKARGEAIYAFYKIMPSQVEKWEEEAFFTTATMCLFYGTESLGSFQFDFGETLKLIWKKQQNEKPTDSFNTRVMALIACSDNFADGEMAHRLGYFIRMAKSKGVGINWYKLLEHLLNWNNDSKWVQKQWAKSYFVNSQADEQEEQK